MAATHACRGSGYDHLEPERGEAMTDEEKRVDEDTPQTESGAAVDEQGVGQNPTESTDTDENADPKSGGTPVHPAPTEGSPAS
jgi:hypothetical protein